MTAFATQSNIQMTAPGILGRAASGVGKSKLLTASELRGLLGTGSAGLGTKYLADDSTWKSIDLSGYVPYTGATAALNLGSYGLTCGAITATAFSLPATGNMVVGEAGNERLIEFYNSAGNVFLGNYSNAGITVYKSNGSPGAIKASEGIFDSTGYVYWTARGALTSSANGVVHVQNYDFNESVNQTLAFGAATTSTNGARIKRVVGASLLAFRNGDDSADAPITCGAITASGQIIEVPPSSVTLSTNGQFSVEMTSDTAGNLVYRGSDGVTRRCALTFV